MRLPFCPLHPIWRIGNQGRSGIPVAALDGIVLARILGLPFDFCVSLIRRCMAQREVGQTNPTFIAMSLLALI